MFEQLSSLDAIVLNFGNNGSSILNITLAFVMFGVALGIKPSHFKTAFMHPKAVITGFISQALLLPAVTFLLCLIFKEYLTLTVALGCILIASCPGGNISNFISSLCKGNIELSVSLTALSTVTALFLTPVNFAFWGDMYAGACDLVRPINVPFSEVFKTLVIMLGIPLCIGLFISWKFPDLTKKIHKIIQNVSILIFVAIVIIAFSVNFEYFMQYIKYILIIVLVHNGMAYLTGYTAGTVAHLNRRDRITVTIETGIQNSGLALMLIFNPDIFPADLQIGGMAFVAAWWGVWHIISSLILAGSHNLYRQVKFNRLTEARKSE